MMVKLRIVEVSRDGSVELPEKILPVKLEPVIEHAGGIIPVASSERFLLFYLETGL